MRARAVSIAVGVVVAGVVGVLQLPAFGAKPAGERRARAERSGHFEEGAFVNLEPTSKLTRGTFGEMLNHQFFGDYDHLDLNTVTVLAGRGTQFVVPLGVGAHLERWGIAARQITDLDWHERTSIGELLLTATPARHYSGRGVLDSDATLWAELGDRRIDAPRLLQRRPGYSAEFAKMGRSI